VNRAAFGIVVPSLNSAATLDRTLASLFFQAGSFSLHVHVQDGGSTDETLERLAYWKDAVEADRFPGMGRSLKFTFDSESDAGPYDAIVRGWEKMSLAARDWMSWLNSDDVLSDGALQFIARVDLDLRDEAVDWITGSACVCEEGVRLSTQDRAFSKEILQRGLADGIHWDFVQQEGTFFRNWLWNSVDPQADFRAFLVAGDWNLWRCFAASADLYQVRWPLGVFSRRQGQLSERLREVYYAEIDAVYGQTARAAEMKQLSGAKQVRSLIEVDYATGGLSISKSVITVEAGVGLKTVHGYDRVVDVKNDAQLTPRTAVSEAANSLIFDREWQYPAITEKNAIAHIDRIGIDSDDVLYFGFPWATLFDLVVCGKSVDRFEAYFSEIRPTTRGYRKVVSVCQHILLPQFSAYMKDLGVTDVFWSHARVSDRDSFMDLGFQIHPLGLYPVNYIEDSRADFKAWASRQFLFSFVGAIGNDWYLTDCRDIILRELKGAPHSFVLARDEWHFQRDVYEVQISGDAVPLRQLSKEFEREYCSSLAASRFVLCPSGSGPNTIRLWEALAAGAIPVVLSDTLDLPGGRETWSDVLIFVPENFDGVVGIPRLLDEISRDELEVQKRLLRCAQLYAEFGPGSALYPIDLS
jgi:glycosyltransferase involved in cell wall biosynthesis